MNYKELLYDKDKVLSFFPELAIILNKFDEINAKNAEQTTGKKKKPYGNGLNKAIFINQLNYWLDINEKTNKNFKEGYYWVYNSYESWAENDFQYWSPDTVKRIVTSLENIGVVVSANYNKFKIDKTKWYRIDYKRLQEIIDTVENEQNKKHVAPQENADCGCDGADCPDGGGNLNKPIPENTNKDYSSNSKANSFFAKKVRENKNKSKIDQSELEERISDVMLEARIEVFSDDQADNVESFMLYFIDRYAEVFGKKHPLLGEKALWNIGADVTEHLYVEHENMDFDTEFDPLVSDEPRETYYEEIVDMYFETEFKQEIDYSMAHFSQKNVLVKLMGKAHDKTWYRNV